MTDASALVDVIFWVVAVTAIAASVMVVAVRDVLKSAIFLAASFLAVAGLYVLLRAEFLAAVQILIYVGAVSILIIFTIMMVRQVAGGNRSAGPFYVVSGGIGAVLVALAVIFAAFNTDWSSLDAVAASDERVEAALTGQYASQPSPGNPNVDIVIGPAIDASNSRPGVFERTTGNLGELFIRDYVLAFEVISVVLLAALIGALALVREQREA